MNKMTQLGVGMPQDNKGTFLTNINYHQNQMTTKKPAVEGIYSQDVPDSIIDGKNKLDHVSNHSPQNFNHKNIDDWEC